jgi:hypothetical protein
MKWLHNLLKGASLTGALFVFQACYGMPQNALEAEEGFAPMSFSVFDRSTNQPLQGIKVMGQPTNGGSQNYQELGTTDANGRCKVNIPYRRNIEGPFIRIEDPDGLHATKDTVLYDLYEHDIAIKLNQAI